MRPTRTSNPLLLGLILLTGMPLSSTAVAQDRIDTRRAASGRVKVLADLPYAGTENPRQQLDLLLPAMEPKQPLPVIAFVHGGGWRNGDKRAKRQALMNLVATGDYAAVSIGYRLSDEAKWPNQIHDCKAAIRWMRANAATHGLDGNRIAVWGTSAGGHLVAMLGTSAGVDAMDGELGNDSETSVRVTCVVDFYGPTDLLRMNAMAIDGARMDHDAPDSPESLLIGEPIQLAPEKTTTASPIKYVTPDDPPFLIVHGTQDPLVAYGQSVELHDALRKAGVSSTLLTVQEGGHGKGFGANVDSRVRRFLEHHLLGHATEWQDESIPAQPPTARPRR